MDRDSELASEASGIPSSSESAVSEEGERLVLLDRQKREIKGKKKRRKAKRRRKREM